MHIPFIKPSIISLLALSIAGCVTPPEVRELSKTTATYSSLTNTRIVQFSKNAHSIALKRADAISELSEEVDNQQSRYQTFSEALQASVTLGSLGKKPNPATLIKELEKLTNSIHLRQKAKLEQRQKLTAEILASQSALSLPKNNLKIITQKLGSLSKEASPQEQIEFLQRFFESVADHIEATKTKASDAEKSALEGIKKNKKNI
ncbi:MAG: hypothetical protein MI743_21005 [Sneathiellales bacterium]|nr:hypothetical protein [Sneathiellales bacterium]